MSFNPRIAIEVLAWFGLGTTTIGIYLLWGLAPALIGGGLFVTAMAINAARLANVSDRTPTD